MASNPLDIAVCAITFIAICFVLLSFLPQFLAIFKTKNTVGFNKLMFFLHMMVAVSYLISCILAFIEGGEILSKPEKTVRFSALIFVNAVLVSLCAYMIYVKITNQKQAIKLGVTELEHYKKHIQKETT